MKRLLLIGLLAISFSTIGHVSAADEPARIVTPTTVTAVVDGIEIPYRVLLDAQNLYQGHAVTRADKVTHNGQSLVRLRVDNDDVSNDYTGIYMFYDKDWKLMDNTAIIAPPAPPKAPEPVAAQPTEIQTEQPSRSSTDQPRASDNKPRDELKPDAKPDPVREESDTETNTTLPEPTQTED